MNKKFFFPTFLAVVLFAAGCEKQGDFAPSPVYKVNALPVITSPADATVITLTADKENDPFVVTWTGADFGFRAATTYTVEIDRAGNDFADAVILGTSTGLSLNSTVSKLNTALFTTLGLPGETISDVEMRLVARVSSEVDPEYSAPVSLQINPYTIVIIYPQLQVPGSYQGWDPANNSTIIFSAKSDNRYEGYIYFNADNTEHKYTDGPSWTTNYGDTGEDGTLDQNGDNLKIPVAGVYRLNVNLNNLTHTRLRTDWGLIGSATGSWDVDQNMTYDPVANKWTITLDLVGGEIKFRANDDWGVNFGDTQLNKSLEYGGDNIPVADPGNYTIDLILSGAVYTYNIKKN
ncbi:MAG: SusE domain-containing protein [Lewinellaceae bacterium]|nr:SusE domain-containing protein [Lewinellaceae bacterium]